MQKSIYQTFDEQHEDFWSEFRDRYLEEHTESDIGSAIDQFSEEDLKEIRAKANTNFFNFVTIMLNDFKGECLKKGEIWKKRDYPYDNGWIVNDDKMKETLKRYQNLLDVINFIDGEGKRDTDILKNAADKDWRRLCDEMIDKIKNFDSKREEYSNVIVDKSFYQRAEEKIGFKKITMQKYLQAFCKLKILVKVGQLKTHDRAMLYVDGYFYKMPPSNKRKKVPFLNQKRHQQALRELNISGIARRPQKIKKVEMRDVKNHLRVKHSIY